MRIKVRPDDFKVDERIRLPEGKGAYAYYRVEKRDRTTLAVRDAMAAALKVTPSALVFPARKDNSAVATQYVSVRKRGPALLEGHGYVAERVGWGSRALRPGDLDGNHYTVVVRDLDEAEAAAFGPAMLKLGAYGLPNYFDDQRFGSRTRDGFIGKEILRGDAERVVHMYLAEPMVGDRREMRRFKRLCAGHWGEWGYLLHQAPRPSNFRSVITHLKDHPHAYRDAVNLIKDRLLSTYLAAYQSWVWNRIVGAALEAEVGIGQDVMIMREHFPLPEPGPDIEAMRSVLVDLPRLTAQYEGVYAAAADQVFASEGLDLQDFKAHILRRVYLTKGERAVAFLPTEVSASAPQADDEVPDRWQVVVAFALSSDVYATLVIKAAAALIGAPVRVR
jgi:tRNA pseudouridine13 synthase